MGLGGGRPGGSGPAMDPAAQLPPSGGAALDLVARRLFSAYPPRRGVTPPPSVEARLGERGIAPCFSLPSSQKTDLRAQATLLY